MPTANIYGSKMIYISSGSPASTFRPGAVVSVDDGYGQSSYNTDEIRAYMSFDIPDAIRRKQILGGTFYVYARSDDPDGLFYYPIDGGYRDNINWNNKPSWHYNPIDLGEKSSFAWKQKYYPGFVVDPSYKTGALQDVLLKGVSFCHGGRGVGQLYTPYSNNKPYVLVEYTDIQLNAYGAPKSGFVDRHKEIKLIVTASPPTHDAIEEPRLQSATIRWRNGESGEWNQLTGQADAASNRVEFVIAPDSVTTESLHWGIVNVVSNDGVTTNGSAVNILSTVDSASTAVPKEPVNIMINVEEDNEFQWQHVIATGSDPTGFDIQYTADGLSWQPLASKTGTAETRCLVAANAIPAGKLQWRVRTYNGDGVAGQWSEPAAVVGYGAPPAPIISQITNSARPTIRWQSATQIAYELVIRRGDVELVRVGETAGTDKAYTVSEFLYDGAYTVFVRIENSGLYWSQWASANFVVQTEKPTPPEVEGESVRNGVLISVKETSDMLYLLRDGIPIARIRRGQTIDYSAVGGHEYTVRRVNSAGAFADSIPIYLETRIEQALIAPADTPEDFVGPLLQTEINQYSSTASTAVEYKHYAGRKYPVAVTDRTIDEEFSPTFAAITPDQWQALRNFMEDATPIIYRNSAGDCAYCMITSLNPTKKWNGFTVWEMTLGRIDYVERINYEEVD